VDSCENALVVRLRAATVGSLCKCGLDILAQKPGGFCTV
jgi:hypothetical protein